MFHGVIYKKNKAVETALLTYLNLNNLDSVSY